MKLNIPPLNNLISGSPARILILVTCIIFMASGAVNNGFSWFYPAAPFAIVFVFQLRNFSKIHASLFVILAIIICLPLAWNHPKNSLLYPSLNAKAVFQTGWGYHQLSDTKHYSLVPPKFVASSRQHETIQPEFYVKSLVLFENPKQMHLAEMKESHPDFGTSLWAVFEDAEGNLYSVSENNLIEDIREGTIISKDLQTVKNLQSRWTWYLGNLMYWPIFPLLIPSIFK